MAQWSDKHKEHLKTQAAVSGETTASGVVLEEETGRMRAAALRGKQTMAMDGVQAGMMMPTRSCSGAPFLAPALISAT